MAAVEKPMFVLPKKRAGKKNNSCTGHVDHIISIQGTESDLIKYKSVRSPVTEHVVNGIIHSSMDGLKSNMKMNLPIITDDEEVIQDCTPAPPKNGYQPILNLHNSREIIDLSPIYENSSDACSSHDDLQEASEQDLQKISRILNSDHNESSSATPNSLSQTHSEVSLEMGPLTDSLKNSSKRKKRVNIVADITEMEAEISSLNVNSQDSILKDSSAVSEIGCLTISGTIKRGKKKGQNVDVKLNISREELEMIERSIIVEQYNKSDMSTCSLHNGLHIFILGLLCMPVVSCASSIFAFFMGTKTWYNILNNITEDPNYLKKVLLAPILILLYPFLIVLCTLGLGLYAGVVQLTFRGSNWWKEVRDPEKGFYSWLCDTLHMSECSPYEVIILTDVKS